MTTGYTLRIPLVDYEKLEEMLSPDDRIATREIDGLTFWTINRRPVIIAPHEWRKP